MSTDPYLKNESPALVKLTTKADEIKELKIKTAKHDHENILKSLKIGNDNYKKMYKCLNEKKVFIIFF